MSVKMLRTMAAPLVLALVLAACGQHPGVHVEGDSLAGGTNGEVDDGMNGGSGQVDDDGMAIDGDGAEVDDDFDVDGDGDGGGTGDGGGDGGDGGNGGGGGGDADTSDDGGNGGGDGDAQQQGTQEPQGSDRTGVDDDTITVGVHAPVTGAAPLPSEAFNEAGDLYWNWVTEEKGESILGRDNVEVVFADDRYEPATARQVCRELGSRAFLVVGGGGTDQIQACGQLAAQTQVPYFSPGVTEAGLEGNPWYFAASMTYPQQGELLAEMVRDRFGDAKTGAVVTQTPNFDGAVQGWERGVQQHNVNYATTLRHPRGQSGWYADFANQLGDAGVEVVYVNTSPLDYIRFAQVASDQGHDFQFVGVGVTMGLNAVLDNGCDHVDGGLFFSPFPALESIDDMDPEFRQAADTYGVPATDLAMAIWGISKAQHELFRKYENTFGTDLTREDFRAVVESAGTVETGVFPPVNYSPDVDFGGQGVHILEADCSAGEYRNAGSM